MVKHKGQGVIKTTNSSVTQNTITGYRTCCGSIYE